jgi:hypothetical protein
VVTIVHGEPLLLGWVSADAREAFACICRTGPSAAADLAHALDWPEPRMHAALDALALLLLIRSEGDRYHPLLVA